VLSRDIQAWLFILVGIGDEAGYQVNHKIGNASVAGMFDLRDIFQLIIDGFDNRAFPQQNFIHERHQAIAHIFLQLGDELNSFFKQ